MGLFKAKACLKKVANPLTCKQGAHASDMGQHVLRQRSSWAIAALLYVAWGTANAAPASEAACPDATAGTNTFSATAIHQSAYTGCASVHGVAVLLAPWGSNVYCTTSQAASLTPTLTNTVTIPNLYNGAIKHCGPVQGSTGCSYTTPVISQNNIAITSGTRYCYHLEASDGRYIKVSANWNGSTFTDIEGTASYLLSITKKTDAAEPATNAQFEVALNFTNTTGAPITGSIGYTGTATNGTDYATAPTTFSIPVGASSTTIDIVTTDDSEAESAETIIATLSSPSSGTISTASATATMTSEDVAPRQISISKTQDAAEPATNAQFMVSLDAPNATGSAITGSIAYSGTATNGTDYATAPTTFSIPDGASSTTIDIVTTDDSEVESEETVIATLSSPSSGTISTASATATMTDDDKIADHVSLGDITNGDSTPSAADDTDFGSQPLTTGSDTHSFTINNNTGSPITVTQIEIQETPTNTGFLERIRDFNAWQLLGIADALAVGASDFSIDLSSFPYTINNGSSQTFNITFAPQAAGLRDGIVVITFNDGSTFTFAISGNGTVATLTNTNTQDIPVFGPFGLLASLLGLLWFGRRRQ